jgi:hypothetical protein
MSDDSKQVTVLIKELLLLNTLESASPLVPPTVREVEERKCKRKKLRQELVEALHFRDSDKS